MSEKPTAEEVALWQRRLASQANNRAWTLAEQQSRTADEDEEMLQAAHAAMHFWKIAGDARNRAHAAQLVAHAYALLKLPNPAAYYLARARALLLSDEAAPWERAMAHAVAANVAAAQGDSSAHREHYRAASELGASLADRDRGVLLATLRVVPAPAHD